MDFPEWKIYLLIIDTPKCLKQKFIIPLLDLIGIVKFKAEKKANLAAASSSFSIAIDTSQIIKKIIQPDGENFSLPSCVKKVKKKSW